MANYSLEFSCQLDVLSLENTTKAFELYNELNDEINNEEGRDIGFVLKFERDRGTNELWIYSDENGYAEDVTAFALKCAEVFKLKGLWSFCWSLSADKPLLDAYGGGAAILDFDEGEEVEWLDCNTWAEETKKRLLKEKSDNAG